MDGNGFYPSRGDGKSAPLRPVAELLAMTPRDIADYFTQQLFRYPFLVKNQHLYRLLRSLRNDGPDKLRPLVVKIHSVMSDDIRRHHGTPDTFPFHDWENPEWFGNGDIELGALLDSMPEGVRPTLQPVRIPLTSTSKHLLIAATTDVGKSRLAYSYMLQALCLHRRENPAAGMWFFELRKDESPTMFYPFKEAGIDLQLLTWKDLKINLLQPPRGVDPEAHKMFIAGMLANTWQLGQAGELLLQICIDALYARYRCLSTQRAIWPDVFALRDEVAAATGRHAEAKKAILLRLDDYVGTFKERGVGYSTAFTPDILESAAICFRMDGLKPIYQTAILTYLAGGANTHRIATNQYDKPLSICCEEASNLLYGTDAEISQRHVFELLEFCRAQRLSFCIMTQYADLPGRVLNVLTRRVIGWMFDAELSRNLGGVCTRQQIEWAKRNLRNRWFVLAVDTEDGRRTAVVFRSKDFAVGPRPLPGEVPNTIINRIPVETSADALRGTVRSGERTQPAVAPTPNLPALLSTRSRTVTPPQVLRLLTAVAMFPDRAISQHATALGLSSVTLSRIITALTQSKIVRRHDVYAGFIEHYRILELLEPALPLLSPEARARHAQIIARTRRNGVVHGSLQRRAEGRYIYKGSSVVLEALYKLNGGDVYVDLVKDETEGYEFEITTDGIAAAQKLTLLPFTRGYLVVTSQERVKVIRGNIAAYTNGKRLDVVTFKDLYFEALPQYSANGVLIG